MSELRFVRPRLRRLGIGFTVIVLASVYACGGNDEVFGPNEERVDSGNSKDSGVRFTDSSRGQEEDADPPKALPPSSVTLGADFACVVAKDRSVWCWGRNDFGQLGRDPRATPSCGAFPCAALPAKVEGLPRIATVKAGKDFACALDDDALVWCWGNNAKGQILARGVSSRFTPETVAKGVAQLDAAGEHACFLSTEGFVHCWGDNTCDLFGRPDAGIAFLTPVPRLPAQTQISLGVDSMCTVAPDTSVLCWGTDHKGSLGHPLPGGAALCNGLPFDPIPKRLAIDGPVVVFTGGADVHVGLGLACVRTTEGKVLCWGDNTHGGLGQGYADPGEHRKPMEVPAIQTNTLAVGGETGCAIVAEKLLCWGDARYGQLDSIDNTECGGTGCRPLGYIVPGQQPVRGLAVSATAIATIKSDASLWLWGKNDSAEIGAPPIETGNVACAGTSKCIPAPRLLTTAPPLE